MATEHALASIPTEQIVLKLLQELASRVENLEKENYSGEEKRSSEDCQPAFSTESQITNTTDSSNAMSLSAEVIDSHCLTCEQLLDSCHCFEIPYGHLLEGDVPSRDTPMVSIEDRGRALRLSDPEMFAQLKRLGFAGVPADGRLHFKDFWPPNDSLNIEALELASTVIDTINRIGCFEVVDFDSYGASIQYGSKKPISGEQQQAPATSFHTPPLRINPDAPFRFRAPWKRLIMFPGISATGVMWDTSKGINKRQWGADANLVPKEIDHIHKLVDENNFVTLAHVLHLSWFEVEQPNLTSHRPFIPSSRWWKQGRLYGGKHAVLNQVAFTLETFSDPAGRFWTVLALLPPNSRCSIIARELHLMAEKTFIQFPLPIVLAGIMCIPLNEALHGWRTLVEYIDGLLGTGDEIFDTEAHDSLMFDDDLYTRSKRYFWVINCINEADKSIGPDTTVWPWYRDRFLLPFRKTLVGGTNQECRPDSVKELDNAIEVCEDVLRKLEVIHRRFQAQRTRALALRDGLFSASAVMESRASTRLGENVKLLTYVSIFYLPLAFCTSIWSTTDTFGYNNLIYTMVAIGLATYLIVFNLNPIVQFVQTTFRGLKIRAIDIMQKDSRNSWRKKGELFHQYRPRTDEEHAKPSEWWILVYLLRRGVDFVRFWGKKEEVGVGGSVGGTSSDGNVSSGSVVGQLPAGGSATGANGVVERPWFAKLLMRWRGNDAQDPATPAPASQV